ncbi:MAG: hypothetical protein HGA65_10130 [Oscillochloris sp.]|nr:hypothetical protein [Oscillochloris sp.]
MKHRNEAFGRLLKAGIASIANCEGRTASVIEEQLGSVIGVSGDTVQRYKTGHLPPDDVAVKILAEAAVQRGFLGREWLQRFLHAARYPFADQLLDALCPAPLARPRPPRIYENLPAPTYSQFVMRPQAFAEVCDGLAQRTAVVLIVGLGGNGKTSLAREVAARTLQVQGAAPPFDAVVWVSDNDRPGTTNLSTILDTVALTLDYPAARSDLFADLFSRAWTLLDEAARRVLLALTIFPTSVTSEALAAAADVQGFTFDCAAERLIDLALIDLQQERLTSPPRYVLHPLVRAFALAQLREWLQLDVAAREQWAAYLLGLITTAREENAGRIPGILDTHAHQIRAYLDWAYHTERWGAFLDCYWRTEMLWDISVFAEERIPQAERALAVALQVGDAGVALRASLRLARLYSFYRKLDAALAAFARRAALPAE